MFKKRIYATIDTNLLVSARGFLEVFEKDGGG